MGYIIDRAKERIGRVKADRATNMGIAGHQAAMDALSSAAGYGRRGGDSADQFQAVYASTEPDLPLDDGPTELGNLGKTSKHAQIESNVVDRHKPTEDF